jgi:hypothetical protein
MSDAEFAVEHEPSSKYELSFCAFAVLFFAGVLGWMGYAAAHLVDPVIPQVPGRQWVLPLPIPLRILFTAHSKLLTPLLRIVHCVITGILLSKRGT